MAGYAGGRIKRIKIRNFMTYDDIEILPKDGLNLIVGLNGSGKSSIMCAICLGLAGKPQFTGRASTLSDFIKHGEHQAEIEIELENVRGNNAVINRKIRGGEKCVWHLNKRPVSQTEVTATVKKFNIDTSNLCQFLPQEKVVEFSRMDKKQRLENMLQAIGEPHLFELFTELKELRKQSLDIEFTIKKSQQTKSCDEEKNDRISGEVQKQESRVRLKNDLDDLFNKRTLIQYKELQAECVELKEQKKRLKREFDNLCRRRDEAVVGEDAIRKKYWKHSGELDVLKSKRTDLCSDITRNSNLLLQCNEQVHNAKIEYKNRMKERENQKKRLQDINVQIDGLEKAIQEEKKKNGTVKEKLLLNTQQIAKLHEEISEYQRQLENVSAEGNSLSYSVKSLTQQLTVLKDEHNKKMSNLRRFDKYTYEAVCWLNENKDAFRSRVYQPIMLEIKVHSAENCKYVENHISIRDMLAFVCEDKEDCKRLTDILRNQKKLPVNIVMAPDSPLSNFQSPVLTPDLRSYGLECFLIDLFSAPEPVMKYLCSCYHMHNIPVAKSAVDGRQIETILKKFRVFFSANTKISGKRSRYGDHNWSVKKDFISERKCLINFDDEQQKAVEKELQRFKTRLLSVTATAENLKKVLSEKDKIENQLRNERKEYQDIQKKLSKLTMQLASRKSYREQMSVAIVKEIEASKVSEKVQYNNQEKEKIYNKLNELFKSYNSVQRGIIQHAIYMNCFSKELKLLRAANEEIHEKVIEAETKLNGARKLFSDKKKPAEKLLEKVKTIKVNAEDLKNFIEAPSVTRNMGTLEETEEKINHIQAQLNLNEDNEPLIKEFNDRKQKIAAILADIEKYGSELEDMKKTIQEKKKEWLKPLQHHISNINRKFSKYFKYLSCAGEINLDIPDNSEDFVTYGLQIKLKFHDDEPLTELSQTHHSGGECSVAAIIFILSLQELTEVPFRCIDEINQGMDSINERKIYQLIADSVGDDRCSQYFLLTPKLLMDLQYPEDVAVHIIYNSCFLNITLDIKKHLQAAQSA